ncbi:hypothetical protein T07_10539 [Trichinella nelsoni]|uniref:Uncharacterized protein n=1 Tax=Trichinella nelsoni TaxID=6336 RepID=A0A0V0RCE3_9BILA|nr:hypothetical protein T07_10539 [Trichinella nelsoni]
MPSVVLHNASENILQREKNPSNVTHTVPTHMFLVHFTACKV